MHAVTGGFYIVTSLHLVREARSWEMLQGCSKGARPEVFIPSERFVGTARI